MNFSPPPCFRQFWKQGGGLKFICGEIHHSKSQIVENKGGHSFFNRAGRAGYFQGKKLADFEKSLAQTRICLANYENLRNPTNFLILGAKNKNYQQKLEDFAFSTNFAKISPLRGQKCDFEQKNTHFMFEIHRFF